MAPGMAQSKKDFVRSDRGSRRFVVDAMLGNVARELRLLGYDAVFARDLGDGEILRLCQAEGRVLVTRDRGLAARAGRMECIFVAERDPSLQTVQVLRGVGPLSPVPFSRCLSCNGPLRTLAVNQAWDRVPDHVALHHRDYRVCDVCGRVYWEGTHAGRLQDRVQALLGPLQGRRGQV